MAWTRRLVVLALSLALPTVRAEDIVVYHNWASPAELAALNVLRQAVEAQGHRWIPLAIPHDVDRSMDVLSLIEAGASPNAFLQLNPAIYRALDAQGRLLHLDAQLTANGAWAQLPDVVRAAITVDGSVLKVPATIHADATIYYNAAVAADVGIDPRRWTSLETMWADFPAVRRAGHLPIAMGAQPWQIGYLTHSLVASIGGPTLYHGLYGAEPERAALDSADLVAVFAWLRRFQQESDADAAGRDWNMATAMVITGEALLQVQGDWVKGEWRAAGKAVGADFGCMLLPGARALPVTIDSWGLLGGVTVATEAAERSFADIVVNPRVQAAFAAAKGSTPVRLDARDGIDACSQTVLAALDRPDFAVLTPHLTSASAWVDAVWSAADAFWNDPTMTPEMAIARLNDSWLALYGP